jgi:hypothetical protein
MNKGSVGLARACAVLFLLLVLAPGLSAIGRADFDAVVDFSITMRDISAAAEGTARLPSNRLFLLDGTVSDIVVLDKTPEAYAVRIRLLSGEWIGLEDVKGYSCYVTFRGADYAGLFPSKIPNNTRILILVRSVEVASTPTGEKIMALDGLALRVLR